MQRERTPTSDAILSENGSIPMPIGRPGKEPGIICCWWGIILGGIIGDCIGMPGCGKPHGAAAWKFPGKPDGPKPGGGIPKGGGPPNGGPPNGGGIIPGGGCIVLVGGTPPLEFIIWDIVIPPGTEIVD